MPISSDNVVILYMDPGNQLIPLESLSKEDLAIYIETLISQDFPRLIQILYRLDISEAKLKNMLATNPNAHTGTLITQMIIDRLEAKRKSRDEYSKKDWGESEVERW